MPVSCLHGLKPNSRHNVLLFVCRLEYIRQQTRHNRESWMHFTRLALALIIGCCLSSVGHGETPSLALPQVAPVFRNNLPHDALQHVKSGFVFPAQIGNFKREKTHQFDELGEDISVGYNNLVYGVVATIYVYPAHGSLADEFKARQAEIASHHQNIDLLLTSKRKITPKALDALTASYRFDEDFLGKTQGVRSELVVAQIGTRFVEYRFSYPVATQANASVDVINFESTFAWPLTAH